MRVDANVSVRPAGTTSSARAARSRTSTRCARSAGPSTTRSRARSTCSRPAAGSCRRPGTGTRTTAGPTPCAPRRRPTTTATSPSPTWCRSRPTAAWLAEVAAALPPMPAERRARVAAAAGLPDHADAVVTVVRLDLDAWSMAAVDAGADAGLAVKRRPTRWPPSSTSGHRPDPDDFRRVVLMEGRGELDERPGRGPCSRSCSTTAATLTRSSARLGFEAMADDAAGRRHRRRDRRPPGRVGPLRRRRGQAAGPVHRPGEGGDRRPGRPEGGGVASCGAAPGGRRLTGQLDARR